MFETAVTIKQCQRQTVKDRQSATYGQRHCVIDAERLPNKRKTPATSALAPESEPLAPKVSPAVPKHGRQSSQLTSASSKISNWKKLQLHRRYGYVLLDTKGHSDVRPPLFDQVLPRRDTLKKFNGIQYELHCV
jgi:hypothetical protein